MVDVGVNEGQTSRLLSLLTRIAASPKEFTITDLQELKAKWELGKAMHDVGVRQTFLRFTHINILGLHGAHRS